MATDLKHASLAPHVRPVSADAYVTAAVWMGTVATFALGDGTVLSVDGDDGRRTLVHPQGAILTALADRDGLVSGGDDGRVCRLSRDGAVETIAEEKGRWIDALAIGPAGAIAWSAGKRVTARDEKGRTRTLEAPSTPRGLAFAPKGYRLAVAHQNGASLWFPNTDARPEALFWKGSHIDVTWSPDGRFLVSSMQESSLHVWRLADGKDMRMAGYPGKTRSFSWRPDGPLLATSGADAAIVWPFDGKDGPMGRSPREFGLREARVARVAFHPKADVLASGYDDGSLILVRLSDGSELEVAARSGASVTALAFDRRGDRLAFGREDGSAGIVDLPTGGSGNGTP